MEDYRDIDSVKPDVRPVRFTGSQLPTWCSLAIGGFITFVLIYLGVARPASLEMARMREQLRSLERSISRVAGHTTTAYHANELLAQLSEQARQSRAAAESLEEIRWLHQQLQAAGRSNCARRGSPWRLW